MPHLFGIAGGAVDPPGLCELWLHSLPSRKLHAGGLLPVMQPFVKNNLLFVIQKAFYEGRYWNTTGIGRHVIVSGMIPEMRKRAIKIISHGATGRGNDQVRFQLVTNMLAPEFEVYAPWRDQEFLNRFRGRSEMIDYCTERKLPIKTRFISRESRELR